MKSLLYDWIGRFGALAVRALPGGAHMALPPEVAYPRAFPYWRLPGGKTLQLQICRPRGGRGPFPAVLLVHGGAWFSMEHWGNRPLMGYLAQRGLVAVSVGYQQSPRRPFPSQIHQVKGAVRWLRARAPWLEIDPNRIAVVGYSTGGNLACLLGMTTTGDGLDGPGPNPEHSSHVQAVVGFYPLVDLAGLHEQCRARQLPFIERAYLRHAMETWLQGDPLRAPERYGKASLLPYVRPGVAPTLLIHGLADRLVPVEQSRLLRQALLVAGVEAELLELEGAPHNFSWEHELRAAPVAADFLIRHVGSAS